MRVVTPRPSPPLKRATFSTDEIEPEQRLEAWRALVGLTHEVEGSAHAFHGKVSSTAFGSMVASEMSASPLTVARSPQRARRDGLDHIVLHLTTADFAVDVEGASLHVPRGAITVNTLSRPFRRGAAAERNSQILSLSRDLVVEFLPDPEAFHGRVLHRGFGDILGAHMRTLVEHGTAISPSEAAGVARATAQLIAAGLEPTRTRWSAAKQGRDAALSVRCRRYIEAHLRSPGLTPDSICREMGVSRSVLYRLFEDEGGVAGYIRARRLSTARSLLASADTSVRVSEIGSALGFTDATSFSRAFKAAFGMSPSEAIGLSGTSSDQTDIFGHWMRTIAAVGR
ncbi:helix-turn-helix domain-containing protein [Methylobacterium sp. 17Sr1-1]|uniref:helix-turn-helix domain-containing protein n=1 Tax=Methylobacterium sp. 17Sr1-1 TaxID=2202826 RepID=UPI000D6FAADB|nr:helix-turn-helix domain-containing protein [Methylobacterium sp. 17Sr1-1]AWN54433.1 hypothetical protein DK412_24740 [Methylobacterium sp. 17Sr1-1]